MTSGQRSGVDTAPVDNLIQELKNFRYTSLKKIEQRVSTSTKQIKPPPPRVQLRARWPPTIEDVESSDLSKSSMQPQSSSGLTNRHSWHPAANFKLENDALKISEPTQEEPATPQLQSTSPLPTVNRIPISSSADSLATEQKSSPRILPTSSSEIKMAAVTATNDNSSANGSLKEYSALVFLDKVPLKDPSGRSIPDWKRQMMARQLAERTKLEDEVRAKVCVFCFACDQQWTHCLPLIVAFICS